MSIKNWFSKNLHLKQKTSILQLQEAADFVDFILLNLEAGINIEQSFFQAANNLEKGELKKGAEKMLALCRIGFSFGEALNFVLNTKNFDASLKELLENLSLSMKLGSPLVKVLHQQGLHFRLIAAARLEELANEAPVKMIFPLVLFIFPVIFILLASGAIENLVRSFHF